MQITKSDFSKIDNLFFKAEKENRNFLYEFEVYEVLKELNLKTPYFVYVTKKEDLSNIDLERFRGDKVVCKIVSKKVFHKTDVGGVSIIKKDFQEIEKNYEKLINLNPSFEIQGVIFSEFIPYSEGKFGHEILVGIRLNREFGPIIAFGAGGVDTEFYKENLKEGKSIIISSTLLLTNEDIRNYIKKLAIYPKISGQTRDKKKLVEDGKLIQVIEAFQAIANNYSHLNINTSYAITEMEVNPFVISEGELIAIDGLLKFERRVYKDISKPSHKIKHILKPESIAIIGASEKMNLGHIILNNIIKEGFNKEKIFVIKDSLSTLEGCKCYPTIKSIPEKVDLLIIAIPAEKVLQVIEDVLEWDLARSIILIPGGMGETERGEEIEKAIKERLKEVRIKREEPVVVGGNCLGVISKPGNYNTFFIPTYKMDRDNYYDLKVACASQSGAFVCTRMDKMKANFYYAISTGNQIDLSIPDYLEYLKDDLDVNILGFYIEGFQNLDGLRFAKLTKEAIKIGKDILVYKAGRTKEGTDAAKGHTASMTGDYEVAKEILKQSGALIIDTFEEFEDFIEITTGLKDKKIKGNKLGLLSNAGYETVGMADNIREVNCQIPKFKDYTKEKILKAYKKVGLDKIANIKNPLDITPVATDEVYELCARAILEDEEIDAAIISVVPPTSALQTLPKSNNHKEDISSPESIVSRLIRLKEEYEKPFVVSVDFGTLYDPMVNTLKKASIPTFRSADRALKTLGKYINYRFSK